MRVRGLLRLCQVAAGLLASPALADAPSPQAQFGAESPSLAVRRTADWVVATGDNTALPFLVIDKIGARVFAFSGNGALRAAAPVLLGLAQGDVSPPGIGDRPLSTIAPAERITPSGRFVASLGRDFIQDILWVDYGAALSLHRVVTGKPTERRLQRLATPSALDNRISYGCINVPVAFYDSVVRPLFKATTGIVYILPETTPIEDVFAFSRPQDPAQTRQ